MISKRRMLAIDTLLILSICLAPITASYVVGNGDAYRTLSNVMSGFFVILGYYMRMLVEWSRKKNA